MWRKVTLFLLIILFILILTSYVSLIESFLVWLVWNHGIAAMWPVPLVNYLQCSAFLVLPNFIFIIYRAFTIYKNL